MLTIAQLKQQPHAVREASAWFLPDDDPEAWLETCATSATPVEDLRFYVVSDSLQEKVAGALVVGPAKFAIPPGNRAQAYGELRSGFYLPVDALLWPPLSEMELTAGTHYPVALFHPALGLTGFETGSERRAWDLLQAPTLLDESWNRAQGSGPAHPRLRSIRLQALISMGEIFGEESQDIGREPPENLPPMKDEPGSNWVSRTAGAAGSLGAEALAKLLSLVPRTSGIAPTWINDLENWASAKLASLARNLDQERHKELHRLLDLLANNPDEGLRHAISLANLQSRGRASPSARLGRRPLDFNLKRIGGSGPSDTWSVPNEIRSQLVKSYREMAQREQKLGRFRRAACIYAELLGDLHAAAGALKQGRHFQEAALLYRERLNSPLLAAECFAEAGLLHEAIAIYEQQARWIEVSDLYVRLGQPEEAERALRSAVKARLAEGDVIKAAELLETKLNVPEEALALLASTWPDGRQAVQALAARFDLLHRHHRDEDLRRLIHSLVEESIPKARVATVVGTLTQVAEKSPVAATRQAAAEAVRSKAAPILTQRSLDPADEIAVLRALARLAPEDRLLMRDVTRFREERKSTAQVRVPPAVSGASRILRAEKGDTLRLPTGGTWIRALTDNQGFCAVARLARPRLFFTRANWKGALQSTEWDDPAPEMGVTLAMAAHANSVVLARPFADALALKNLPATDAFSWSACDVGTPDWWPKDAVQVASSGFTLWVVRIVASQVVLASYQNGALLYSRDVTAELTAAGATGAGTALLLDAQGGPGRVALAYGQHLLVLENQRELSIRDLGGRINGLLPTPGTTPGWVALLERGAVFAPAHGTSVIDLDDSMIAPRGAVLKNGTLLLAAGDEARNIQLDTLKILSLGRFALTGGPGFMLSATDKPEEFAVFHSNGVMQKWSIAR